jgi:hypothetical protein
MIASKQNYATNLNMYNICTEYHDAKYMQIHAIHILIELGAQDF